LKVLMIRPGALGDTLMLMPSVTTLGAHYRIAFVGRSPGLFYLQPYVHTAMDYEGPGWHALFLEDGAESPKGINLPNSDLVTAFLSDPEESVKRNLKFLFPEAPVYVFPPFPPKGTDIHVALYLARCLEKAGISISPKNCLEKAKRQALFKMGRIVSRRDAVVFHPGSGSVTKNHPPAFWLELIRCLRKNLFTEAVRFILLLGPAERPLFEFYTNNLLKNQVEAVLSPDREILVNLLGGASLYIGHDSGITHLSAMLGTPSIALFKNSSLGQWRPLGPFVSVIKRSEGDTELMLRILQEAERLTGIACRGERILPSVA